MKNKLQTGYFGEFGGAYVSEELKRELDRVYEEYLRLKKDKDFQRSIGKEIEVRTFRAIDKQKEFTGILKEFNKDSFTIVIEDNEMTFQRSETALVRLAFDF